jgi:hypothetical protein
MYAGCFLFVALNEALRLNLALNLITDKSAEFFSARCRPKPFFDLPVCFSHTLGTDK